MRDLDRELRDRSDGLYCLDDVARQLSQDGRPVSLKRLRTLSARFAGGPAQTLSPERLGLD